MITKYTENTKRALERAKEVTKKASIKNRLREINKTLRRIDEYDSEIARNKSESIELATEASVEPNSTLTPLPIRQQAHRLESTSLPTYAQYEYPFKYENPIRERTIIESVEPVSRIDLGSLGGRLLASENKARLKA